MDAFIPKIDALQSEANAQELLKEFDAATAVAASQPGNSSAAAKAQQMVLRGRIKSKIPSLVKEGEQEIQKSLRMSSSCGGWLALSECQWIRGALREAMASCESAISCDPESVAAIMQMSRIARSRSVMDDVDAATKQKLRALSMEKARAAIAKDMKSSAAWLTLALALFQDAANTGMAHADVKKALSAAIQATRINPADGDALLNRGIIEHSMLMLPDAALSFQRAAMKDESTKAQTGILAGRTIGMMKAFQQRAALTEEQLKDSIPKKQFGAAISRTQLMQRPSDTVFGKWSEILSLQNTPPAAASAQPQPRPLLTLVVLRLISGRSDVPLVYEAVDTEAHVVALCITNLSPDAIPVPTLDAQGRIPVNSPLTSVAVFVPPAELCVVPQTLSPAAKAEAEKTDSKVTSAVESITKAFAPLHVVNVNGGLAAALFVNGLPCDPKHIVVPLVKTERIQS